MFDDTQKGTCIRCFVATDLMEIRLGSPVLVGVDVDFGCFWFVKCQFLVMLVEVEFLWVPEAAD